MLPCIIINEIKHFKYLKYAAESSYLQNMDLSDKERYSISKVGKDSFVLTDADTLQTWQIEILRNSYNESEAESEKKTPTAENK